MKVYFSDDITKLAPALVAAQAEMGPAVLDSKNPAFRSRYASLSSVLEASVPPLNRHGIAVLQHPTFDNDTKVVEVTTILMHNTGQRMWSTCALPLGGKKDGHALKSATTYLRRVGLITICGLPEADDDGNATSAVSAPVAPKPAPVSKGDIEMYNTMLGNAGVDPAVVAAFMKSHGRNTKGQLNAKQLHARLQWATSNVDMLNKWSAEQ
tara:strand:- start:2551 stop:3180 length:630 start_codon:yes stop_codon:yes gene_type:complete